MPNDDQFDTRYVAALRAVFASEEKDIVNYLYQCLSIIDAKSASLLQFNSLIIAASTVLLGFLVQEHRRPQPSFSILAGLTATSIMLMLISSCILLRAVWIYWAKTSHVTTARYVHELLARRTRRTAWYRVAWSISILTLPVYLAALLVGLSTYLR